MYTQWFGVEIILIKHDASKFASIYIFKCNITIQQQNYSLPNSVFRIFSINFVNPLPFGDEMSLTLSLY